MPEARPLDSPSATSGLQYISVLSVAPSVWLCSGSRIILDIPKSVMKRRMEEEFLDPIEIRMLADLISMCLI